jgi:hypothetical protein
MIGYKYGLSILELYLVTWELILSKTCNLFLIFSKFFSQFRSVKNSNDKITTFRPLSWFFYLFIFEIPLISLKKFIISEKLIHQIDSMTINSTKDPLGLSSALEKISSSNDLFSAKRPSFLSLMTPNLAHLPLISYIFNTQERCLRRKDQIIKLHSLYLFE